MFRWSMGSPDVGFHRRFECHGEHPNGPTRPANHTFGPYRGADSTRLLRGRIHSFIRTLGPDGAKQANGGKRVQPDQLVPISMQTNIPRAPWVDGELSYRVLLQ